MNRLHRWSIRHPVLVLTIAVLVTAAAAPGIARLRLRTDGHALVPEHAPEVLRDRAVRFRFGVRDPLVVLIRPQDPRGIYNPGTLRLVVELTRDFTRLPGLDSLSVKSLATETSDHFRPGTLEHRLLLEPIPATESGLDSLRGDIAAIGLLTGTLVSFDGTATAILLGTPPGADRGALVSTVREAIARVNVSGHAVDIIGAPAAEALLGLHILEDLGVSRGLSGSRQHQFDDDSYGAMGAMTRFRLAIARRIGLLPLSIGVMGLVFLLAFRNLTATFLPLIEAGACLLIVFGLMGWSGVPVYLTTAVLPVILVSMGLADEIHVFSSYSQRRAARPEEPIGDSVRAAFDDMSLPVVATAMTTAIGFLSFAISPLGPVRAFGLFTALGILVCMVWTLSVIPALLVLLRPSGWAGRRGGAPARPGSGGWDRLAGLVGHRPAVTLVVVAVGLGSCFFGIRRLAVQDSWISGFARDSAFYRATQYFNRQFFGTHLLLLALDAGHVERRGAIPVSEMTYQELRFPPDLVSDPEMLVGSVLVVTRRGTAASQGPATYLPSSWTSSVESAKRRDGRLVVTTPIIHGSALFLFNSAPGDTLDYSLTSRRMAVPGVLRRIDELEGFVRGLTRLTVGGVLGPPDHVATAEYLVSDRASGSRAIPDDPDRVSWLWDAIGRTLGPRRLHEVVDPRLESGLVTVFMKNANFIDTAHLMEAIRHFAHTRLGPHHIRLDFAGDVAVSQTLIEGIVTTQVRSLLGSLLGILFVTALLFRSLRWGLVCTAPAALSVAATFAVMGWIGMPLGVATSMFAGMVLGIGVDFAIHLVERFRMAMARGTVPTMAIVDALVATGPAILINALAVALGFGILVLSRVPANAQLGAITAVSLVTCLGATFLVIPALLRLFGTTARPND